MKRFISLLLVFSVMICAFVLTSCNSSADSQNDATEETTANATTEASVATTDFNSSKEMLDYYFDEKFEGENPVYGVWEMEGADFVKFAFRNDGYAQLVMGTWASFSALEIDQNKETLTTDFYITISGTYNYSFSDDFNTMTLTSDDDNITLNKVNDFSFVPQTPKKITVDQDLIGWWKNDDGLIYYFGDDGIMYTNIIATETCYTYTAENGNILAYYDMGDGENMEYSVTYTTSDGIINIDGNDFYPYNPFE